MGHNDPTDVVLQVGGLPIREFTGLFGWKIGHEANWNEGPGGEAFGFNTQRRNNKVEFELHVRSTSPDLNFLHNLSQAQSAVAIMAEVARNLDSYEVGQEVGLGCERGILLPGEKKLGAGDAEDVVFKVIGIGPIVLKKESQ